jgi:hypothetical protein
MIIGLVDLIHVSLGLVILAILGTLGLTGVCIDWEGSYPNKQKVNTSVGVKM